MLDITALLEEIKAAPYADTTVKAPHSGMLQFAEIQEGTPVAGPSGEWKEIPGTPLATIVRENNPKIVACEDKGFVLSLHRELNNTFVQAGTELAVLRHNLSKDEVVRTILRRTLFLFCAPERAKYYFAPEADKKIKISGARSVTVNSGMELFIVSRMKREVPLVYEGPSGVIFEVYCGNNRNVDAGCPLIGVCPPEQLDAIEEVIRRVQLEWTEI